MTNPKRPPKDELSQKVERVLSEPYIEDFSDNTLRIRRNLIAASAITLFYKQVVRHRGIPLELKIPKDETLTAMRELKNAEFRKSAKKFKSVKDLMVDLND